MGALGVVTGVGDGNFTPNQKLTREQAANFADSAAISSWAAEAVGQMQA
jgi:S-layer homology domain.